eukprot:2661240-Rhodomonas_salina.1
MRALGMGGRDVTDVSGDVTGGRASRTCWRRRRRCRGTTSGSCTTATTRRSTCSTSSTTSSPSKSSPSTSSSTGSTRSRSGPTSASAASTWARSWSVLPGPVCARVCSCACNCACVGVHTR